VEERNIDYIWRNRLAYGKHTLIAGEGGGGKTTIACDIVARITKGLPWGDKVGKAPVGRVIYLSAEDDLRDTLKPRLTAAGADLSKILFLEAVRTQGGGERKFSLQDDLASLKTACNTLGDVVLIVIDPVTSYMGGNIDANSNTKIRSVLDPVGKLAQAVNCGVLTISHFNKGTGAKAVNKVIESVAFTTAPRAAFGVFRDTNTEEQEEADFGEGSGDTRPSSGQISPLKINMGEWPKGIKFKIVPATGGTDKRTGEPVETSRIEWGELTTLSADDIVAAENQRGGRGGSRLYEAVEWYENTLSEGPLPPDDVEAAREAAGISQWTGREARRKLKVQVINSKDAPPKRLWSLALGRPSAELDLADLDGSTPAPDLKATKPSYAKPDKSPV
jgi:putative DNA primase/helicase